MSITNAWLKANLNKPIDKVITKNDRDGLSVRITQAGKIVFQMRYRYAGKPKRLDIGSYPAISLAKARAETLRYRAHLEEGNDPKQIKVQERSLIATEPTFSELFNDWYESVCVHDVKKPDQIKRTFEIYVLPQYGKIKAGKIDTHHWATLIDEVKTKHKRPAIAARILAQLKKIYRWSHRRKTPGILSNPVADLSAKNDFKIRKNKGKRVLDNDEIALIWEALRKLRMAPRNKMLVKLCLFFGCRVSELRLSRIVDFDLGGGVWTIPEHKSFNTERANVEKPIKRPIIDEIKPCIERLMLLTESKEWLFTKVNTDEPMPENSHLDFPYQIRQYVRKHKKIEMPHWSCHDLRRTMRTRISKHTTFHIAEIMIGHKIDDNQETYDQYDYLPEQAEAYHKWYCELTEIVGEF